MDEPWLQAYVHLAFRLDKILRMTAADSLLVDYYYGPAAWKTQVEAEPPTPASMLLQNAEELSEMLACLDLEPQWATFLGKQMLALHTICQKLCDQTFSLADELRLCFDLSLPLTRTPETAFERAWMQAEETLPGTGDVLKREAEREQRLALPLGQSEQIADFADQALASKPQWTNHVQRAKARLSVAQGQTFTQAAKLAGYRVGDSVAKLIQLFNAEGVDALHPRHTGGAALWGAADPTHSTRSRACSQL